MTPNGPQSSRDAACSGHSSAQLAGASDEIDLIGRRTAGATAWVLLELGAARLLRLGANLVLVHLLSPADFGVVAFALIAVNVLTQLQDLGVRAAIIYERREIRVFAGTALTLNVAAGLVLFGVTALGAPALASLGRSDQIAPVAMALSLTLVISSLSSVHRAWLAKTLAFRRKFLPETLPVAAQGLSSIMLAVLGFGAWSLVGGYVLRAGLSTVLFWYAAPMRLRPEFKPAVASQLLRYGGHTSFDSIVGIIASNLDLFLVGYLLGPFALGIYALSLSIVNIIHIGIQSISTATFPGYSLLNSKSKDVLTLFGIVIKIVFATLFPLCIILFLFAPVFVTHMLHDQWSGAASSLRILTLFAALRSIQVVGSLYRSVGHPELSWWINLLRLFFAGPLMVYLSRFGVDGVATAQALAIALVLPVHIFVLDRRVGFTVQMFWQSVAPTVIATAGVSLLVAMAWSVPGLRVVIDTFGGAAVLAVLALGGYIVVLAKLDPRLVALGKATVMALWPRGKPVAQRAPL